MRSFVLIAAAPLVLTACNPPVMVGGNTSAAANTTGAVPDSVEVNGVTYVRADKAAPAPAPTPTASTGSLVGSAPPNSDSSTTSDSGASVPPNTDSGSGAAADHGN